MSVPSLTLEAVRRQIDIYTPFSPMRYGAKGDGTTNDLAALAAAITAASTGDIIDLGGRTYNVASPLTISKGVVLQNGSIVSSVNRVALVTGAAARLWNVSFTRTGPATASLGCLVLNAADCILDNVTAVSNHDEALRLGSGTTHRTKVLGGSFSTSDESDSFAIQLLPGSNTNDLLIDGARVRNTGYGTGIGLYNCSRTTTRNCDVRAIRRSPLLTMTGWTNTTGNIWTTADRTDTGTNALYVDGTEYTKDPVDDTTTTPSEGHYTNVGGNLYLHLEGGGNPNSVTVTSTRTNGYGILYYATDSDTGMVDNLIQGNYVEDTDGFGLYYQTLQNVPRNNRTSKNTLRNVCKTGITVNNLPFGAIGVFGGVGLVLEGDYIDGVGSESTPAPGISFKASAGTQNMNATIKDVTVRNSLGLGGHGVEVGVGYWRLQDCVFENNDRGVTNGNLGASGAATLDLVNCYADSNRYGVYLETASSGGLSVSIRGGRYQNSTLRNIVFSRCRGCYIGGGVRLNAGSNNSLNISGTSQRIIMDGIILESGVGINFSDALATEIWMGIVVHNQGSGTKLSIGVPYRLTGFRDEVEVWVIPDLMAETTPESLITSGPGSLCIVQSQGTMYLKTSGTGNTGWTQLATVAP